MFDLLKFSIEDNSSFSLSRKALVFIEGTHKDSMGRVHDFSAERIKKFVDNTNSFIRLGGRIPFQLDHKKTQDCNIGDVEGEFYTKVITKEDLPNPKYKHLLGKVGVFVDSIVGKGKEVVEQISQGLIKTLSPGLDPMTESFIEVSATPTPAIIGPALFSKDGDAIDNLIYFEALSTTSSKDKAFSFDDLYNTKKEDEDLEEEYKILSEDLFHILSSIASATDEELSAESINPIEASYDAIEYFLSNLEEMFGLVNTEEEQEQEAKKPVSHQPYPIGKTASEYSRFKNKKSIGFTLE